MEFFNAIVARTAMVVVTWLSTRQTESAFIILFLLVFATALMIMMARWRRIAEYATLRVILCRTQPWLQGAFDVDSNCPPTCLITATVS